VIRVKDPKSSRTTLIGIGFRERDQAFDFKNALNEYIRYIDRSNLANKLSHMNVNDTDSHSSGGGSKRDGINFDNSQIESYLEDENNRLAHPHSTKNENVSCLQHSHRQGGRLYLFYPVSLFVGGFEVSGAYFSFKGW
jgi:hypothetical protein